MNDNELLLLLEEIRNELTRIADAVDLSTTNAVMAETAYGPDYGDWWLPPKPSDTP